MISIAANVKCIETISTKTIACILHEISGLEPAIIRKAFHRIVEITQDLRLAPDPQLTKIASTLRELSFPRKFAVEICADCNLQCAMCHHPQMRRDANFRSYP